METKKISIELKEDIFSFIQNLTIYENTKREIKTKKYKITDEDIIKAAIIHYINDIKNYYKQNVVKSEFEIKQSKLKNRFKAIMKEKGLIHKNLSLLTGIDKGTLSNILNNKVQPQSEYFLRLWVVLDYPQIEDIFYYD